MAFRLERATLQQVGSSLRLTFSFFFFLENLKCSIGRLKDKYAINNPE